jgi:hypothetical protein
LLIKAFEIHFDDRWPSSLNAAGTCDVPTNWPCCTGVFHRCESGLVAGQVQYEPEPLDAPAPGNALLCCSLPAGAITLDV